MNVASWRRARIVKVVGRARPIGFAGGARTLHATRGADGSWTLQVPSYGVKWHIRVRAIDRRGRVGTIVVKVDPTSGRTTR
jgi:hypothetical protein